MQILRPACITLLALILGHHSVHASWSKGMLIPWQISSENCQVPGVFVAVQGDGTPGFDDVYVLPERLELFRDAHERPSLRIHAYKQGGVDYVALSLKTRTVLDDSWQKCIETSLPHAKVRRLFATSSELQWMPTPKGLGAKIEGAGTLDVIHGEKWISVLISKQGLFKDFRDYKKDGLFSALMTGTIFYSVSLGTGGQTPLSVPVKLSASDDSTLVRFVRWRLYGGPAEPIGEE